MMRNSAAAPEYATAQIAVWWDMKDCPVPEGYDAGRVRPSIVGAFKNLGYSGPVSITAYGDHTETPDHLLRGLSSTGVAVAHTNSETRCSIMFSDMLEWRRQNPPPATMMLISDQVEDVFSWDLARLQQETKYNLFLAYSLRSEVCPVLYSRAEWLWKELLDYKPQDNTCTELPAMFYCKSCDREIQCPEEFSGHLSSTEHAVEEFVNSKDRKLDPVTRKWGRNYAAKPEYATAKIAVWWDMYDCPIPHGYDARRVRPSLEGAFKKLGYSGPVSITAYGDHTQTPDDILRGLSSTGVAVAHTIFDVNYKRMYSDMLKWGRLNPPPATMMIISDQLEDFFSRPFAFAQQLVKFNLFLAYSFRPYKMSVLVTSAEWLWDSLLAVSEARRHLLQEECSQRTHFLQKCSARAESESESESTGMFYCRLCNLNCDYKSLESLRTHLSSDEHTQREASIYELIEEIKYERRQCVEAEFSKTKRLRKS